MHRIRSKRSIVIGVVAALALAAGAYAYWTAGGSGTGSAATGTNVGITVIQTSTPTGLYPGATPAGLSGNFNNTNASKVLVHQVSATIGTPTGPNIDGGHPCTAADYQLGGFPITVDAEVDSGTGVGAWTGGTIQLKNTATNQDGCKGATVPLTYSSN